MNQLKETMMKKNRWAIVGATDKKDRFGYKIPILMREHGYEVYGVSPKYDDIEGIKVYKSLADIPERPEVVNMVVNPAIAEGVLREAAELGINYIFFQPHSYDDETVKLAEELGLEVLLDDCVHKTLLTEGRP